MTLLLATLSQSEIILTADGLSVSEQFHAPGRTTLQKIFPLGSRRMAIAQCGGNFVKDKHRGKISIACAISDWNERGWPEMVVDTASCVEGRLRDADPDFFTRLASEIWITGFSNENPRPEFCRLNSTGVHVESAQQFTAGAGAVLLRGASWNDHNTAWSRAASERRRGDPWTFGGHRHQLRISSTTCDWEEGPVYGMLGVAEILPIVQAIPLRAVEDPRRAILSARKELQSKLCRRARKTNGRHPTTFTGARGNWAAQPLADDWWRLAEHLIAICDEAELARPSDVAILDAQLYLTHAQMLSDVLPPSVEHK